VGAPHLDLPCGQEAHRRDHGRLFGARTAAAGWTFADDPDFPDCTPDTVNGFRYLHEAYTATDPRTPAKVTVPTLWDKKTRRIVTTSPSEINRMLNSE
jgi:putative glutathione S-transferase